MIKFCLPCGIHTALERRRDLQEAHLDRSSAAVFTVDPDLRNEILACLKQLKGVNPRVLNHLGDFESLLQEQSVCLVLPVLSNGHGPGGVSTAAEFDKIMQFLPRLRNQHPFCQVLLITSSKLSLHQSCQAVANGVANIVDRNQSDFCKVFPNYINTSYRHFQELQRRQRSEELSSQFEQYGMVGSSSALAKVIKKARQAARISDASIIIYGESGTGKQRLAEMIHELDEKRNLHPFVCVNCAAIAGTLAESEMFGHKKGAFTGASEDRPGYFRTADGGTILLDEIGELDISLQPKILRVSQENRILPVGSDQEYHVDVRLIAATHRDLEQMVHEGRFRLDLYQRLNVIQLKVPPLRQRKEDIPVLFESFLKKYAHYSPCGITSVDPYVYEILAQVIGPGNIRELENIVRQILAFKESGQRIEITDLPSELVQKSDFGSDKTDIEVPDKIIEAMVKGKKSLADAVDEYESFMLARLVERGVSRTTLAGSLGITRRTLYNKLQKYNLSQGK